MVSDSSGSGDRKPGVYVLILVVVEYGLGHFISGTSLKIKVGLNPCCSGIWSRTRAKNMTFTKYVVLILVVVEYGLGLAKYMLTWHEEES